MPELPEIQTTVNDLIEARLPGRKITDCRITWARTVLPLSPENFQENIVGQKIESIRRRGKYIVFRLSSGGFLITHLRMTGQFELDDGTGTDRGGSENPGDPHDRVSFRLDDGRHLRFHDTRKFGRMVFTRDPESILNRLGPEPFDPGLKADVFFHALHSRRRRIKALLLDQSFLAGLGNIYCDEALYLAGIHPLRCSGNLSQEEAWSLLASIRKVLYSGLRNRGTSLGEGETNYLSGGRRGENRANLRVYGRDGEACPSCGSIIEKIYVGQRGSHFCPHCQPL